MSTPSSDYRGDVRAALAEEGFLRLTFAGAQRGAALPWQKVTVRPVLVKRQHALQFSFFDGKKDVSRNLTAEEAAAQVEELLARPFAHLHVQTVSGDLHVRITKKGKAVVSRGKPSRAEAAPDLSHDREKRQPLGLDDSFLQAIGITNAAGRVRPAMAGKLHQVNEFLRLLEAVLPTGADPLTLVDLGCGNAYLTFAAYHYLNDVRGVPARVIGVDREEEVIARARALQETLGWTGLTFEVKAIAEYQPEAPPEVVLSLHACDTATDDALAQGVRWGSRVLLAAPCCQHELSGQLANDTFRPVLRHGILQERMADLLTDALRALLLRIAGYRTDVVQFVDPEHTAKNLMIRAVRGLPPGDPQLVREYQALRDFWGVKPYLEAALANADAAPESLPRPGDESRT